MQILLAAIGSFGKQSPELALYREYEKRLSWKAQLKELEIKKNLPGMQKKEAETSLLLDACKGCKRLIALDEKGESLTSVQLAQTLGNWQRQGDVPLGIIIGGGDGLDRAQLQPVDLLLSFGRLTWPHMLIRAALMEQLYRAETILRGHPYHRE